MESVRREEEDLHGMVSRKNIIMISVKMIKSRLNSLTLVVKNIFDC